MVTTSHQRVAVTSDQSLVAEAIGAALASRGFATVVLRWPSPTSLCDPVAPLVSRPGRPPPEVALMLSDLDRPARLQGAVQVMTQVRVPWVVLAGVPRGPIWGALLEIGAELVAPISTTLDEVGALLVEVANGRAAMCLQERRELTDQWHALRAEQRDLEDRLASMTPRESEVLRLLYAGTPVRTIAAKLLVSEATVRSQVKTVLRKLDVRSQLAAVAALQAVQDPEGRQACSARTPSVRA